MFYQIVVPSNNLRTSNSLIFAAVPPAYTRSIRTIYNGINIAQRDALQIL